ncbi:hypothetical protein ACXR0M_20305 [Pseudomonas sp. Eth.TT006]
MRNEIIESRDVELCISELRQCDIGSLVNARASALMMLPDDIDAPSRGSIVGEGILGFSGDLTDENRTDAQNAFLFASLAASRKYPEEHQGKEWYTEFRQVMALAGWMSTSQYYSDLTVGGTSARMDKLVLDILGSVVAGIAVPGSSTALMLKVAGDAISALQKRDTATLTVYEQNLLKHGAGGMTAGACVQVGKDTVMAVGAVRFNRHNTSTKVLFVDVDVRNVQLYRGETVFTKNDTRAAGTRAYIAERLIPKAEQILDIEI